MSMTRRGLLNAMDQLGGVGAAYETLVLFDFLKPPPAMAAGWSGWQDGAIISAWEAVRSIDRETNPTAKRG